MRKRLAYQKEEHSEGESNTEHNQKSNMETAFTIAGIIGGLLLAVGGYLISFGNHKISSIWFFFSGAVFLCLSAALYLHNQAVKESPEQTPAIIRSPPAPTPAASSLTPSQIVAQLHSIEPLRRKDVGESFNGARVCWEVALLTAEMYNQGKLTLMFTDAVNTVYPGQSITGDVVIEIPEKGNEYIRLAKRGERFMVTGIIYQITFGVTVWLKHASLKPLASNR